MKVSSLFRITLASMALVGSVARAEIPAKIIAPGELNLGAMLQPVPLAAKFINDSSYIWCGSLVKSHIDQKYHLFDSRWPRKHGFTSWVNSSEIAHAVADSPFGPFEFKT